MCTVRACEYGTSTVHIRARAWCHGVFIRELHPLLPGEQLTLWTKLNLVKFLCQYKVWALSEIFIQRKFCAIQYNYAHHIDQLDPSFSWPVGVRHSITCLKVVILLWSVMRKGMAMQESVVIYKLTPSPSNTFNAFATMKAWGWWFRVIIKAYYQRPLLPNTAN